MKKILLALALVLTVTVSAAAPINYRMTFDAYPVKEATIHGMCLLAGDASAVEVGTTAATNTFIDFAKDVPMGGTVTCFAYASLGAVNGPASNTASLTEPIVLPPVLGCALLRR